MFPSAESRAEVLRTAAEVAEAQLELRQWRILQRRQNERWPRTGFTDQQIAELSKPIEAKIAELEVRIEAWKRLAAGDVDDSVSLAGFGTRLAELRVAAGMSQRELARAMGVSDSQVSRDERTMYAGITVKRAIKVLAALGFEAEVHIRPRSSE